MNGAELAVGVVIDAILAQIAQQSANKEAVKALRVFWTHTEGHMELVQELQEQFAQKSDCVGVKGILGEVHRRYFHLWLVPLHYDSKCLSGDFCR